MYKKPVNNTATHIDNLIQYIITHDNTDLSSYEFYNQWVRSQNITIKDEREVTDILSIINKREIILSNKEQLNTLLIFHQED